MKNLIKIMTLAFVISLASCAKETICLDQNGMQIPCGQGQNNSQGGYCTDPSGTVIVCPEGINPGPNEIFIIEPDTVIDNTNVTCPTCNEGWFYQIIDGQVIIWNPQGAPVFAQTFSAAQPELVSGQSYVYALKVCETFRQTFAASDGFVEDFIVSKNEATYYILTDVSGALKNEIVTEISAGKTIEITDAYDDGNGNIIITDIFSAYSGWIGTPCTNENINWN
jgi:hypothetical protein